MLKNILFHVYPKMLQEKNAAVWIPFVTCSLGMGIKKVPDLMSRTLFSA